jgi:glycosyltransferase involved in cell wall biosynthesis
MGASAAPAATRTPVVAAPLPLRIEMVLPTLSAAGQEVMVANLAHALAQRGHVVGVTCIQSGGALEEQLAAWGIRVSVVPTPGVLPNLHGAPALTAHFRAVAPDVVHVHSGAWGKAAAAARRAGDVPVVFTLHGMPYWESPHWRHLHRLSAWQTDRVVAVAAPLRDYLVQQVRVPPAKVTVLLNGVDTDRYAPTDRARDAQALRQRLGIPAGRAVIGTVARLDPIKHQAMLVDAFAQLRGEGVDADLVIVGDGERREALLAQAVALGIADRVHLPGPVSDTAPAYRAFDAFILCSLEEGTSMSVLEAMASGTPVVATAVGGTPALLEDDCGLLVPSRDTAALAAAVSRVLGEPATAAALATRARDRAVRRYGRAAMVEGYERIYAELAASRARPT